MQKLTQFYPLSLITAITFGLATSTASIAQEKPDYAEARTAAFERSATVSVFGVPLAGESIFEGYIPVLAQGGDQGGEGCGDQIWHLPEEAVIDVRAVPDVKCGAGQVNEFRLSSGAIPIREAFVPMRLGRGLGVEPPLQDCDDCLLISIACDTVHSPVQCYRELQACLNYCIELDVPMVFAR